jgi:molecular chaperone DnaK (HSP70)
MGPLNTIDLNGEKHLIHPQQIFAFILQKLKSMTEEFIGTTIEDVVISVPVSFIMVERKCIRDAGIMSGLNVMRLVNNPIAAALTCAYNKVICSNNVLIFDMGGGSLNVGLVDIDVEGGETVVSNAIAGIEIWVDWILTT